MGKLVYETEPTTEQVDDALRVLRAEYYTSVRSYAVMLADMIQSGEITDWEGLESRIHEECDNSSWVIYTGEVLKCLLVSSNRNAYVEDFGSGGLVHDGFLNWAALAFLALQEDILEVLESLGINAGKLE